MKHAQANRCSLAAKDPTVVIEIGPKAKMYYVHRALLVHHSEYFRKGLQGQWIEAESGTFKLTDVAPAVCKYRFTSSKVSAYMCAVNFFVHWLYTGKVSDLDNFHDWASTQELIDVEDEIDVKDEIDEEDEGGACRLIILKVYAFADRFCVADFQKTLNNMFVTENVDFMAMMKDTLNETECAFAHIPAE